ncbi:hypothetical protein EB74_32985 [Mycobacterium sp. SWH-M5]|nr:hypothetical protein EB74_32985 [Mycobacterium sp. SWH-M5]
MSIQPPQRLPAGYRLFTRYAFPPNELGYCGPAGFGDRDPLDLAGHAPEFDGAWPYLRAIARAVGSQPLAGDVVGTYWLGGSLLERVDPAVLLSDLRTAFTGQVSGLLDDVPVSKAVLAHHSFHVLVVYPWIRFLDRSPDTALHVLQNCRIRWGTVLAVEREHVQIECRPLVLRDGCIELGRATTGYARWSRDGASLIAAPQPGDIVSAHWDWVCDTLSANQVTALTDATLTTLGLVNALREVKENLMNSGHLSEEPQEERGAPGSRDTGSDQPSGGPADRPSGTYAGDETVPAHGGAKDSVKTEQAPADAEPAVPPYADRQTSAKSEGDQTEGQGARTGGAVKPTPTSGAHRANEPNP